MSWLAGVLLTFFIGVASCVVFAAIQFVFGNWPITTQMLKCEVFGRQMHVRVSVAVLIRIGRDDQILLYRMTLRREAFGPPGGVVKFQRDALDSLHKLDFEAERVPFEVHGDQGTDIRGRLPYSELLHFRKWLRVTHEIESDYSCILRELDEELTGLGINSVSDLLCGVTFSHVRRVDDGPKRVPNREYLQYRRFDIYEVRPSTRENGKLIDHLFAVAESHPDMIIASSEEIRYGRAVRGSLIASNAEALLGRRIRRPDQPSYVP
jgi:hypothetical protein